MAARNAARRLSSLRSKRGRVAGRIESWDGEYIYRGMDYVPEIFQRHALVPAGTGLETVRCKHQQNNLRQLDHRECTGFFHSHVCLLPKETACTVICDGGRNASPGAAGTGAARRHSPICGCSAVVKMRVRQSSFINTLQRALETMPWKSWKGTVDT